LPQGADKLKEEQMILDQCGMPPKLAKETKRLNLVVDVEWVQKINAWRGREPGVPNLSESIRLLVDVGLEALERQKKLEAGIAELERREKRGKPKPKKP
jgi:hypothetical protein